jgi:hypothetical protein
VDAVHDELTDEIVEHLPLLEAVTEAGMSDIEASTVKDEDEVRPAPPQEKESKKRKVEPAPKVERVKRKRTNMTVKKEED